jgi:hypothetical protein
MPLLSYFRLVAIFSKVRILLDDTCCCITDCQLIILPIHHDTVLEVQVIQAP